MRCACAVCVRAPRAHHQEGSGDVKEYDFISGFENDADARWEVSSQPDEDDAGAVAADGYDDAGDEYHVGAAATAALIDDAASVVSGLTGAQFRCVHSPLQRCRASTSPYRGFLLLFLAASQPSLSPPPQRVHVRHGGCSWRLWRECW
jgi:hypothetical protein